MPDNNKYQKLRKVNYTISPNCGFCKHSIFSHPQVSLWGECSKHRYHHLKHDNPDEGRGVSIVRWGTCPDVDVEPSVLFTFLGAHQEFFTGAVPEEYQFLNVTGCGDCTGPDCEGCSKLPAGQTHGPGAK